MAVGGKQSSVIARNEVTWQSSRIKGFRIFESSRHIVSRDDEGCHCSKALAATARLRRGGWQSEGLRQSSDNKRNVRLSMMFWDSSHSYE